MDQDIKVTPNLTGLSDREVLERRAAGLGNNVKFQSSRTYVEILRENFFTFINATFLTICLVLIWLERYGDAFLVVVTILGGVIVNVCQEIWAKRKLDKIALLTRPKATVIRASQECNIDPGDIVVGDILIIRPGDQIIVDGQIVGDGRVDLDESLLTGESDLVPKISGDIIYSGSFCVTGMACYEAQKVGTESLAYKLTIGARAFRQIQTPLQQEINLLIRVFLLLSCYLWLLTGVSIVITDTTFEEGVQNAAVVAGLVPSGLYLAITLSYALGAVKMLGQDVLIQQANAVESLSNINILCLDKTGTLTANKINLQTIYPINMREDDLRKLLGYYAASTTAGNRTIEAIKHNCQGEYQSILAEVPFASARKWSALSFGEKDEVDQSFPPGVYVLGAPEMMIKSLELNQELTDYITEGSLQGLRMLLFAYSADVSTLANQELPRSLKPLGILSFSDELRPESQKTLSLFTEAGIEIKIISGDNPQTVATLAKQVGLEDKIKVVSGQELAKMDPNQFAQTAKAANIFGRITPDQKAQLVQTLRQQGNYVAMIGDGVNDVLSLKQANLGIAMESGSKATRAVADIVLLKDSFAALPHAFLEGQRIRNGIQDVLKLFMVRVFCVTMLIFSAGVVTRTFPLLNKHSAIVTLVSVGMPSFCIPLWAKPGMLPRRSMVRSLLHFTLPAAISLSVVALGVYLYYLYMKIREINPYLTDNPQINTDDFLSIPRSALVTIMVICGLSLVPFLKPPARAWVGGERLAGDWRHTIVAVCLVGVYFTIVGVPVLRDFFELTLLTTQDYLALGFLTLIWNLVLRFIWKSRLLDRFLGTDLS